MRSHTIPATIVTGFPGSAKTPGLALPKTLDQAVLTAALQTAAVQTTEH